MNINENKKIIFITPVGQLELATWSLIKRLGFSSYKSHKDYAGKDHKYFKGDNPSLVIPYSDYIIHNYPDYKLYATIRDPIYRYLVIKELSRKKNIYVTNEEITHTISVSNSMLKRLNDDIGIKEWIYCDNCDTLTQSIYYTQELSDSLRKHILQNNYNNTKELIKEKDKPFKQWDNINTNIKNKIVEENNWIYELLYKNID